MCVLVAIGGLIAGAKNFKRDLKSETPMPISDLIKFILSINCILFILPYIGLFFSIIGVARTFRVKSGWRITAFVQLILSIASTIYYT